jgi:tRNA threonylcarbamoyladenosine biosynthesis protein TsaB
VLSCYRREVTKASNHILAIDTATNSGGAALSRNGEVIASLMVKAPLQYAEKILDLVDFLLDQHKLTLEDMDCFAVSIGPGSFTGLRIGMATVKGFCQGLNKPVVGISTLEALAYRFCWAHSRVAPVIDARRGQIYGAVFSCNGSQIELEQKEQVSSPAQWVKEITGQSCLFVGDGAQLYKETIVAAHPEARVLQTDNRVLEALCQLADQRFKEAQTQSAQELKANYIRPSDAKR